MPHATLDDVVDLVGCDVGAPVDDGPALPAPPNLGRRATGAEPTTDADQRNRLRGAPAATQAEPVVPTPPDPAPATAAAGDAADADDADAPAGSRDRSPRRPWRRGRRAGRSWSQEAPTSALAHRGDAATAHRNPAAGTSDPTAAVSRPVTSATSGAGTGSQGSDPQHDADGDGLAVWRQLLG